MFEKVKSKVGEKVEEGKEALRRFSWWIAENKEFTVAAVICGYKLGKKGLKYLEAKEMQNRRECMFYDDRTRKWERSRRKLHEWEKDELYNRKSQGEYVRNILRDMDLLK